MDLYCQRCGEPYDFDHVQFEMTPQDRNDFRDGTGCPACKGIERCHLEVKCVDCEKYDKEQEQCGSHMFKRPFRAELSEVLGDILGDDVDGLAVEMEDAEALMGREFWG
jgi:hypothetical protein